MSCNGCRILRKGCNENCILRQSLQAIQSPQAQANATLFVAKFFGRAGLMSFLSSVHESQRPDLFQSLLFEACGRTVNPVNGAVGLQWTGNWRVCQAAVETVLLGGVPRALPEFEEGFSGNENDLYGSQEMNLRLKRKGFDIDHQETTTGVNLGFTARMTAGGWVKRRRDDNRPVTPSDESETTTLESGFVSRRHDHNNNNNNNNNNSCDGRQTKLLRLFF